MLLSVTASVYFGSKNYKVCKTELRLNIIDPDKGSMCVSKNSKTICFYGEVSGVCLYVCMSVLSVLNALLVAVEQSIVNKKMFMKRNVCSRW